MANRYDLFNTVPMSKESVNNVFCHNNEMRNQYQFADFSFLDSKEYEDDDDFDDDDSDDGGYDDDDSDDDDEDEDDSVDDDDDSVEEEDHFTHSLA